MSAQPPPSTTVTVRLPVEVETQLAELAGHTRRSKSFLAREAITAYVERELQIVAGIEQGLTDMRAGRVLPHDQVARDIDALIDHADGGE